MTNRPTRDQPDRARQSHTPGAVPWSHLAAIVALTVVVYLPALRGGFIWDDYDNIVNNPLLRTWGGLLESWVHPHASFQYYPLSYTGFWVEYHLFGLHSVGYHVVNVLLHAVNAFLVGQLLMRLGVPGAWVAALVFAVHPVHVESVAWITELKNALSGCFFLGSLMAFVRFGEGAEHRWRSYGVSLLLFVCALASKTSTVALPVVLVAVLWWKRERLRPFDVLALVPFFLVGVVCAGVTVWVEKHYVGAEGSEWQLSLLQRCLVAGRVVWFCAGKFLWPHPLVFVYPRWQVNPAAWWQYVFPVGTTVAVAVLWVWRQRAGKGLVAAVLCFVGTTAPVPAAFNLYYTRYSYVADHFYYLAGMVFAALAGAGLSRVMRSRRGLAAVALAMVGVLSVLSWGHGKVFRNEETLWRDTLAKNPAAWMAHGNLGVLLTGQGKPTEAIAEYDAALRINPDYFEARYNLGVLLTGQGKPTEAIAEYDAALRINPDYSEARYNLAMVLTQVGQLTEAVAQYQEALRINPDYFDARYNLANMLFVLDRPSEAVAQYEEALRLKPDQSQARDNLGNALVRLGKMTEAIGQYEETLRRNPDDAMAHYNLGFALLRMGRSPEARTQFEESLRIKPDFPEARNNLGTVLVQLGQRAEAKAQFEEALRLKPDFAEAQNNLAALLALPETGTREK